MEKEHVNFLSSPRHAEICELLKEYNVNQYASLIDALRENIDLYMKIFQIAYDKEKEAECNKILAKIHKDYPNKVSELNQIILSKQAQMADITEKKILSDICPEDIKSVGNLDKLREIQIAALMSDEAPDISVQTVEVDLAGQSQEHDEL